MKLIKYIFTYEKLKT